MGNGVVNGMGKGFQRLPGFQRTPPGLERSVLRRLPRVWGYGTLLLMLPSLVARLAGADATTAATDADTGLMTLDLYAAGLILLHWNIVLTVAVGAFIVMVMKGPAYRADAHPADRPVAAEEPAAASAAAQSGNRST